MREARDDIVRRAVRQARDDLVRLQSRRTDGWTWGHQHTLDLESQTLGQSDLAPVAALFNRGPVGGVGVAPRWSTPPAGPPTRASR